MTKETHMENPALPPWISGKSNDSGQRLFVFKNVIGCSIMLKHSKNESTSAEIMPEDPSGIPTLKNICSSPAPSILAASRMLLGIPAKKRYIINTEKVDFLIPHKCTSQQKNCRTNCQKGKNHQKKSFGCLFQPTHPHFLY